MKSTNETEVICCVRADERECTDLWLRECLFTWTKWHEAYLPTAKRFRHDDNHNKLSWIMTLHMVKGGISQYCLRTEMLLKGCLLLFWRIMKISKGCEFFFFWIVHAKNINRKLLFLRYQHLKFWREKGDVADVRRISIFRQYYILSYMFSNWD